MFDERHSVIKLQLEISSFVKVGRYIGKHALSMGVGICVYAVLLPGMLQTEQNQFSLYKDIYARRCIDGYEPSTVISTNFCVNFETVANCDYQVSGTCLRCFFDYYLNNNVCILRVNKPSGCFSYSITSDLCSQFFPASSNPFKFWFYTTNNLAKFSPIDLTTLSSMPTERVIANTEIVKCVQYANSDLCAKCANGSYLSSNKCLTVTQIVQSCQSYSSNGVCDTCLTGYLLKNNQCTQITALNCLTYESAILCQSCPPLYKMLNVDGSCVKPFNEARCMSFGKDSSGNWACSECLKFYFPNKQKVLNRP